MNSLEIIGTGSYLPNHRIENKELEKKFEVQDNYIKKRTGILQRFYITQNETLEVLAINAVKNTLNNCKIDCQEIDMIIVASTSNDRFMPGISYLIQKEFGIKHCFCLDISAGCSGYINAVDIVRNYIALGKIETALVVGADILSKYTDDTDINTAIILSDGAGATIYRKSKEEKKYISVLSSQGEKGDILTCRSGSKIEMDGKEIYKYAVTETVKNLEELLQQAKEDIDHICYIVPHQSNERIMKAIANRLDIDERKIYMNIQQVGNTFCASIPIALHELFSSNRLKKGDKIVLLGYGGGLNTGSILIEI